MGNVSTIPHVIAHELATIIARKRKRVCLVVRSLEGADLIALTNNRLMHLFSSMKLTQAGQMVEHVNYPGQATSFLGLATCSPDYSKECGLIQGWTPDINANAAVANT